jgi:hypothetical protein
MWSEGKDKIYLAQDNVKWTAAENTAMAFRVLLYARYFLSSWTTVSFRRRTQLHRVPGPDRLSEK